MVDFEAGIATYTQSVEAFRVQHGLPYEWFVQPDHIAVKCADSADYEAKLEMWLPKAVQAQYVELDGRRLATARLLGPLSIGSFGQVDWIEIMEPRPVKVGIDPVGIDHMEFIFTDFVSAERLLRDRGIPCEVQQNPNGQWLSISADGHEFKLNDHRLADIIAAEFARGAARVLK